MAFNNVRQAGTIGNLRVIVGDFTQTAGGGSQTYTVAGGRIVGVLINPQVTGEPVDVTPNLYSTSLSGAIATLTIYGNTSITGGTFLIIVDGGGA